MHLIALIAALFWTGQAPSEAYQPPTGSTKPEDVASAEPGEAAPGGTGPSVVEPEVPVSPPLSATPPDAPPTQVPAGDAPAAPAPPVPGSPVEGTVGSNEGPPETVQPGQGPFSGDKIASPALPPSGVGEDGPSSLVDRLRGETAPKVRPEAAESAPVGSEAGEGSGGLAPVPTDGPLPPAPSKISPASPGEFAAAAIAVVETEGLSGQPLPLARVLQLAGARSRQIDATHAYWRLVRSVGNYRLCHEESKLLEALNGGSEDRPLLGAARAAAVARLHQARCTVISGQHELADLVGFAPGEPLPLPGDPPFTGQYRTEYGRLAAGGTQQPRLALIDRTLPLRHEAIEIRARAVELARQATGPLVNAYRRGEIPMEMVLAALRQWREQRHALLESICTYNHDIADYALNVVGETVTSERLLATLIETDRSEVRPAAAELPEGDLTGAVKPAAGVESPATPPKTPGAVWRQSPTPAGPESKPPAEPAATPPADDAAPAGAPPGASPEPAAPEPGEAGIEAPPVLKEPSASEPVELSRPGDAPSGAASKRPVVPVEPKPSAPRFSFKIPEEGSAAALDQPTGQYPGLVDAAPAVRAKQLTLWLHRHDAGETAAEGNGIQLKDALESASTAQRGEVIRAYWRAREQDARLRCARQRLALLEEMEPLVESAQGGPLNEASRLLLERTRDGARADLLEVEAARLAARSELARYVGRVEDAESLTAVTPPHWGGYRLKLEALHSEVSSRRSIRRLADVIPARGEAIKALATAVVEADVARAEATAAFQIGNAPLARVLQRIDDQTEQTEAFLSTLTDYNAAIAEYALEVLSPQTPAATLVGALVVARGS